jgi:phospholipase/carboxylesterase
MLNKELSINYLIKESTTLNSKSPLLLLLHGYGSNEADLHSFANYLPEHYTVVSIRAPHALPSGGFAWYNINFDNDMNKFNDHNQAKNSIKLIMKFLDELIEKYSIESNDISLLGFSQGTILSYALGLNFPERFKKIIGFSGYIDESMVFTNTNNLDYSNLNLYISHGTQDPIIPVDWARKSIEILKKEKINHNYKEFVSGHTISPDNFYDFKSWLDTSN